MDYKWRAVRNICINIVSEPVFNKLLLKTSSFVTYGTNCNTGEKGGLWTLVKLGVSLSEEATV